MSDPFESSYLKLSWAKNDLAQLKEEVTAFLAQKDLYAIFTEPDLNRPEHVVTKMRPAKEAPDSFLKLTGAIVDNLRSALDHAMYAVAIASGCDKPLNAYFPFSGDAADFENKLRGRCADVPKEIYPLLRSYQPYKGGSEALWALNRICIANKHRLVIPIGSATCSTGMDVSGTGFVSMPQHPTWDRAKNEMVLCTLGPGAQFNGNFQFGFYVAFGEIESLDGKSAIPVLDLFADMVETILREIEAETRRIGLIE